MIAEALLLLVFGLAELLLSLFPAIEVPGWLSSGAGHLSTVASWFDGLGVWVPVSLLWTVIGAVIASWGIGLTIKLVRVVVSLFTGGGGAAA